MDDLGVPPFMETPNMCTFPFFLPLFEVPLDAVSEHWEKTKSRRLSKSMKDPMMSQCME